MIATGNYPSHTVFAGANLLVANGGSGTVSVIDTNARTVTQTITVGSGPTGIAANNAVAVVTNLQAGSLSLINLGNYSVSSVALPAGTRPYDVALAANKAVVTTPMTNGILIVDLGSGTVMPVEIGAGNGMGPGAVVTAGNLAYIANQMTANVTAIDVTAAKVIKTFGVDPGPRALAVNSLKNLLLVLAEGTGTLDIVDLASYGITSRLNAGSTERQGTWMLPATSSISPATAAAGSTFNLTISGSNLQGVQDLDFEFMGMQSGGMMGGGMMGGGTGSGMGNEDPNIKVSNVRVNAGGTQVTASVQVLAAAVTGTRILTLQTAQGEVMLPGGMFTVTK